MATLDIISELGRIAKASDGLLLPEAVVEAARPRRSILHSRFCWDDDLAAEQYRLWHARVLIRTTVKYIEINGDKRAVRVFVSLTPDRKRASGGYRDVVAVISDKNMREQMLQDALDELQVFESKYSHLRELVGVFVASKKVRNSIVKISVA